MYFSLRGENHYLICSKGHTTKLLSNMLKGAYTKNYKSQIYGSCNLHMNLYLCEHTVQPDSFSTVGAFSTVDPVVGRIYVQCKY